MLVDSVVNIFVNIFLQNIIDSIPLSMTTAALKRVGSREKGREGVAVVLVVVRRGDKEKQGRRTEGKGLVADLNHCGTFALVLNKRRGPDPLGGWVRAREGGLVTQHGESRAQSMLLMHPSGCFFLTLFHFLAVVYTAALLAMGRSTAPWLWDSPGVDVTLLCATTSRCCMSTSPTRSPGRCSAPGESLVSMTGRVRLSWRVVVVHPWTCSLQCRCCLFVDLFLANRCSVVRELVRLSK